MVWCRPRVPGCHVLHTHHNTDHGVHTPYPKLTDIRNHDSVTIAYMYALIDRR